MDLLERDHDLGALAAALDAAAAGRGRIALIGGEAGIGKTSLLERFIALRGGGARVLRAHCDPLFTPTPLGPLYDLARLLGGRLQAQVDASAARAALFSALFDQLRASAQPTLLAIEDLHWADEATLDMVKFLGRRVGDARIMLAVTFREDEIGPRHPLRLLLGDMASSRAVLRLSLARLSVDAVRALAAGRPVDAALLHRRTAGNPFFVSEVLSTAVPGIPDTVRDAVLARAARLGPAGRRAIEAAAVAGGRIDPGFLALVAGPDGEGGLGDCLAVGIIELAGDGVAFRHELAREAVLAGIEPALRRALNRRAMEALLQAGGRQRGDLAQLVQYAEGAGDAASVREFGLAAARAAAAVGAHREATAQFARVLAHSGDRPPAERAALCESYAEECSIIDDLERSSAARSDAIAL
ncbi:MAG: AAA family ATPase [Alphaproteobacteria bacterium]|nr:AAA family ATPase [Alphaproteobacteria bacterium]